MLSWNNDKYQYEYDLEDGSTLTVSGDEFAEVVEEMEESGNSQAFEDMLEPSQWIDLVGCNPNVEIVKEK